jgi:hypothetical protein
MKGALALHEFLGANKAKKKRKEKHGRQKGLIGI